MSLTWDSSRGIAIILNEKFPRTDVLSLGNKKLLEMMEEAGILESLPEINEQERKDCLLCIKVALSRVIEGDEEYYSQSRRRLIIKRKNNNEND